MVTQSGSVKKFFVAYDTLERLLAIRSVNVDSMNSQAFARPETFSAFFANGRRLTVGLLEMSVGALAAFRNVRAQNALHVSTYVD